MSFHDNLSDACKTLGDGQCDGYLPDSSVACDCNCHEAFDLPATVEGVRDWHDEHNDVEPDERAEQDIQDALPAAREAFADLEV